MKTGNEILYQQRQSIPSGAWYPRDVIENAHIQRQAFYHDLINLEGRVKCFFAPSGSGKSTLINMISSCANAGRRPLETQAEWQAETYPVLDLHFSLYMKNLEYWFEMQYKRIKNNHPDILWDDAHIKLLFSNKNYSRLMAYLIETLHAHYQKSVIVLIDEVGLPFDQSLAEAIELEIAVCSVLAHHDKIKVAALFGINNVTPALFQSTHPVGLRTDSVNTYIKCFDTAIPNPFRRYFAISELDLENYLRSMYALEGADIASLIAQLKYSCTLFTELSSSGERISYLHTFYANDAITELDRFTFITHKPYVVSEHYRSLVTETTQMIQSLLKDADDRICICTAFDIIFNKPDETYLLHYPDNEWTDFSLETIESVVFQLMMGGVLKAELMKDDHYRITPVNELCRSIVAPRVNEMIMKYKDAVADSPNVKFYGSSDVVTLFSGVETKGDEIYTVIKTPSPTTF